ncbi:MAG: dihydroorotase, partial [Phyllobacteriaceae bacterium]|nr:dihydroorotase [Phyllobacteriaceae bacterium]
MSRQVDLILKGGTVVNQDGTGVRDIAVDKGRIVAIGDVSGLAAANVRDCR